MSEKPEHYWFLISRHLSGEISEEESNQLMSELQHNPGLQQQFDLLSQLWQVQHSPKPEESSPDKISRILQLSALEKVIDTSAEEEEIREAPRTISITKRILRYAAMITGLILAGVLINFIVGERKDSDENEIIATNGSRTRAILPDGSTVWLNAGSTISYEPDFNGKTREVELKGEAYFDVIKQPDRPFIVHAGSIDIKVLGTAFNVKSYPDDKIIETTLIRGLVEIDRKDQSAPIYLKPHQKIVLPQTLKNEARPVKIEPAKIDPSIRNTNDVIASVSDLDSNLRENEFIETAWMYNRLEFRGDNFIELAKKLERWYNVSITFTNETAKDLQFNGSLENETVQQALLALQTAVPFKFIIKGNEIYIGSQEDTLP